MRNRQWNGYSSFVNWDHVALCKMRMVAKAENSDGKNGFPKEQTVYIKSNENGINN